jgi:hypothetical protein
MTHYIREKCGLEVKWAADDAELGYQAIADCSATDITSVSEAKAECPIRFAEDDWSFQDVRDRYDELVASSSTSG